MARVEVVKRIDSGQLSMRQGAMILGMSQRHLRRLRRRYDKEGESGLGDGRAGRQTGRGLDGEVVQQILRLYRGRYQGLSMRHYHDKLVQTHKVAVSYSAMRKVLQQAGLVQRSTRRGTYRRRRPRQPMVGMRVHIDGSTHQWLGDERPSADLVIMLDDADGRLLAARFVPEEGTTSTFWVLSAVLSQYGRFCELYMDRGSHHYPYQDEWDHQLTRALKALGIVPIYARSPQARGRCERCFGTLQGRLVHELALEGITDYDAANRFLSSRYIEEFNRQFAVVPDQDGSAFVAVPMTIDLQLLLSIHHQRVVRNDMTVHHRRRALQLPPVCDVRPKQAVTVHTFTDESLGVSQAGRLVATFAPDGTPHHAVGTSAYPGGDLPIAEFPTTSTAALPWWGGGHL